MRILFQEALGFNLDERTVIYRYDEKLGWFPLKNSHQLFKAHRIFDVRHNSRGFRDSEHMIGNKPGIVFLGDSFVWGYDVEKQERFTEKLAVKFPGLSVYNLGVSGYGTDQEYLLLEQQYDYYKPNIVFLIFCTDNDRLENSRNCVHQWYFKPYFTADGDNLTLQGVPVPESWRYFISQHKMLSHSCWFRMLTKSYFKYFGQPSLELIDPTYAIIINMQRFTQNHGANFIIGLQGDDPDLKKFLKENHIPFVELSNPYVYPDNGRHWTPEGHTVVSEKIYNYLIREGYLIKQT